MRPLTIAAAATVSALAVGAPALIGPDLGALTTIGAASADPVPEGVGVVAVEPLSDHHLNLTVRSVAMNADIKVRIQLARDWYVRGDTAFPLLYMLDGMRARDDESGWTIETNAEQFYADKNVNVVYPIGGESSFYANWKEPDNGKNYQWETFLIRELAPLLERDYRTTAVRGVEGLSMGGTAAMNLAARNAGFFKFAASFSGLLQTSSPGMPEAIGAAMSDAGGYRAAAMFGEPDDPAWAENDPTVNAEKLRGTSLYFSSGNGKAEDGGAGSDLPAVGLELLSRVTSQEFAKKLRDLGVPAKAVYRSSGTHSWPYWQFEMEQAWPQASNALTVGIKPECAAGGAIAEYVAAHPALGACLTGEYESFGGRGQDFAGGRVLWSAQTGAHAVGGVIGGRYALAAASLGLPTGDEESTPDGSARYVTFERGNIYWTPELGAQAVGGEIFAAWGAAGYEGGPLGLPTGPERETPANPAGVTGRAQDFAGGTYYWSPETGAHPVGGAIAARYAELGYEAGELGYPTSAELSLSGGAKATRFAHGIIYWTPAHGAVALRSGALLDAYAKAGYEKGLGYPTGPATSTPDGGIAVDFERGRIVEKDGVATVTPAP